MALVRVRRDRGSGWRRNGFNHEPPHRGKLDFKITFTQPPVPRTTHHAPRTTHHAPPTTHHSPPTTRHPPHTTRHPPPTTHHQHRPGTTPSVLSFVPVNSVPDIVWAVWSVTLTLVVCAGGMSMERPAADIFIAGLTQAVPTAAVAMGALAYQKAGHTSVVSRGFNFKTETTTTQPTLVNLHHLPPSPAITNLPPPPPSPPYHPFSSRTLRAVCCFLASSSTRPSSSSTLSCSPQRI